MVNTAVNLSGMQMDNPVIPASGTFGYGYEFTEWYDINVLRPQAGQGRAGGPH